MWYVVQTFGGEEEKTADMIKKLISPEFVEECFVPKRERLKKFHGSWNKVEEVLFHGYAFIISKNPKELYGELKRIPRLTKVLGREKECFFPLNEKEEEMVRGMGNEEHKTPLSNITIAGGNDIQVVDGPLRDYAGSIVKVNLHKKEVVVKVEFMGRPLELKLGVEMTDMGKDEKI